MRQFRIRQRLFWFFVIIGANLLFVTVVELLQNNIPGAYAAPLRVQGVSILVSGMIFAIAGTVSGMAVKSIYNNADLTESVVIGLPLPLLIGYLQRTVPISEVTPLAVLGLFAVLGIAGTYCGILLVKRFGLSLS